VPLMSPIRKRGFQRLLMVGVAALLCAVAGPAPVRVQGAHHTRGPMVAAGREEPSDADQRREPRPTFASSVPQNLKAHEYFQGTPWRGEDGVTEHVRDIVTRGRAERPYTGPPRVAGRPGQEEERLEPKAANPDAPMVAQWPITPEMAVARQTAPLTAVTLGTNWLGPRFSESGYVPPDSNGAVGPAQVMVTANGRLKLYDKSGTLLGLNVADGTFFASDRKSVV
jgi:hypothetical protein